jgi:hypothetical protein
VSLHRLRARHAAPTLVLLSLLLLLLAPSGCSKRWTRGRATTIHEAGGPIEPLRSEREDLSDASGSKMHLRLIVANGATGEQVEDLIRRVAAAEDPLEGELWISVFLEGMDTNSIAYALGIVRPGRPVSITLRDSLQTYQ